MLPPSRRTAPKKCAPARAPLLASARAFAVALARTFVCASVMLSTVAATVAFAVPVAAAAAARSTAAPCAQTTIAKRRMPSGPAQYQSGTLTLKNGASLRVQGGPAEMYQVRGMQPGDPVAACYGPLKSYADAPPSRAITVLDLSNGNYYGTLIGSWKTP